MCMDCSFFEMFRLVLLISKNWTDFCYEELGFSFLELSPLDNKLFKLFITSKHMIASLSDVSFEKTVSFLLVYSKQRCSEF